MGRLLLLLLEANGCSLQLLGWELLGTALRALPLTPLDLLLLRLGLPLLLRWLPRLRALLGHHTHLSSTRQRTENREVRGVNKEGAEGADLGEEVPVVGTPPS